jgi:hypothetical protein
MVARVLGALATAAFLAACSTLTPGIPGPVPDDEPDGFQDCEAPYAFDGETTMAALGLGDAGPDAARPGRFRITQDTITHEEFAPPGAPVHIPEGQVLCVTWADGSGMAMMLAEPWRAPEEGGAETVPPSAAILGVIGLVVVIGGAIAWIAFRSDSHDRGRTSG